MGGPKDTTPPKIEKSVPPNFTTHFNSDNIEIGFDEYIQLKDPTTQITISPPYLPKTDFRVRGKSLLIKLNDSLRSNITYSFYFGDAISDLTEGNILKNYSYVFSTGNYIDSLQLEGYVIDAFTLKPSPSVWVTLYVNDNDTLPLDSLPLHVPPFYRTRSEDNGHFIFHNLKEGKFLLFAVKDQNGNSYFDQPSEPIAFYDSLVSGIYVPPQKTDTARKDSLVRKDTTAALKDSLRIHDSLASLTSGHGVYKLMMFEQQDSVQHIVKKNLVTDQQIQLVFKYPLINPVFEPLKNIPEGKWMIPEFSRKRDTATIWLPDYTFDSLVLKISDRNRVIDTVSFDIAFKREKKKSQKPGSQSSLVLHTSPSDGKLNAFRDNPFILCSVPLKKYDLSRIRLATGRDTFPVQAEFADSVMRRINISYKWKPDYKYLLIVPDSAFTGIDGRSNDSLKYSFTTRAERELGSLRFTLKGNIEKGDLVLQLLGNNDVVIREAVVTKPSEIKFDYLLPVILRIRLIFDENANGKWDSGNYPKKIQPEKILYYPKTIEVRGNWDIDETWEF